MTSYDQLIYTNINCGRCKRVTSEFNAQSSIDQIHEEVRLLCHPHLPNAYCLMFYSAEAKKLIKLNHNQLQDRSNPFRLNASTDREDIESIMHFVDLYVIDTTDEMSDNNTQSGIQCDETSSGSNSGDASTAVINGTESQQDLPVNNSTTNNHDFRNEEPFDINTFIYTYEIANHDLNCVATDLSANQSDSNDYPSHDIETLSDALLFESQLIQNSFVNKDSLEQIAIGDAMPSQNKYLSQPSIELSKTSKIKSNRLYFSVDVKPEQKDIYKSDQYSQNKKTQTNGYVARVQGIKPHQQDKSSVWPKVRIPEAFRSKRNVRLVVFAVLEQLNNGMRRWFKHRDKGFLPKNFTRDTPSINPIEFDLATNPLTIEGDLRLDLQMITWWNKSKELEILYELDEQSTIDLHPAVHEPSSPRLFCILKDDGAYYLDTICLSDFIRSKKPSKRYLMDNMCTNTARPNVSACKRARQK